MSHMTVKTINLSRIASHASIELYLLLSANFGRAQ